MAVNLPIGEIEFLHPRQAFLGELQAKLQA
jgi:hypothetical protein